MLCGKNMNDKNNFFINNKAKLTITKKQEIFSARTLDIILLDIIGYSKLSIKKQYESVAYLHNTISEFQELMGSQEEKNIFYGAIHTGDGFYIILKENVIGYSPLFALSLRNKILKENILINNLIEGIRIATHTGILAPINLFGNINYIGHGLNDCARLLCNTIQSKADKFYGHNNFVVSSDASWEAFNNKYGFDKNESNITGGFWCSDFMEILDKHDKGHSCLFIDCNENNYFSPNMKPNGTFT